jgi:exopolysaccharide biosynthesis polyprenyl glycosylphosphotransferase
VGSAGLLAGVAVSVAVAGFLHLGVAFTAAVLLTGVVVAHHDADHFRRPHLRTPARLLRDVAFAFALVSCVLALRGAPMHADREALLLIVAGVGTEAVVTALRGRFGQPLRCLVVADPHTITSIAGRWATVGRARVIGGLVVDRTGLGLGSAHPGPPLAHIRDLGEVRRWAQRWEADLVLVHTGLGIAGKELRRLCWQLEGSRASLAVAGALDHVAPHRIASTVVAGSTLLHARPARPTPFTRVVKWTFDRLVGLVLLALVAPVLVVLALLIRADSPGPALFRQTRVGKDGRHFTLYKLRTMRSDAEAVRALLVDEDEGNGRLFKIHDDPRITRVGRLLRRASLDELPQLLNVVRGEMSLVGPRPALPEEVAEYDADERRRLAVRPGITGLWQVSGRSDLDWERSVDLDLHYTDNHRLVDDALIGVRTVGAVVGARGAY